MKLQRLGHIGSRILLSWALICLGMPAHAVDLTPTALVLVSYLYDGNLDPHSGVPFPAERVPVFNALYGLSLPYPTTAGLPESAVIALNNLVGNDSGKAESVFFSVDLGVNPSAKQLLNGLQSKPDFTNYFKLQHPDVNLQVMNRATSKALIDTAYGVGTENLLGSYGRVSDLVKATAVDPAGFNELYGIDVSRGVTSRNTLDDLSKIVDDPTYRANPMAGLEGVNTALQYGAPYLRALQGTPTALDSLDYLTGKGSLPRTPQKLSKAQFDLLFSLLYNDAGKLQPFIVGKDFQGAAQNLVDAADYLRVLRSTPKSLDSLGYLTGKNLPVDGTLDMNQLETLIGLLYKDATTKQDFVKSRDFQSAAQTLNYGADYLRVLRSTPGAIEALAYLSGSALPSNGALNADQINFLMAQMINEKGELQKFVREGNFKGAAEDLVHAAALLKALRGTPGALAGLKKATGWDFPADNTPLTGDQINGLIKQLYVDATRHSDAWSDPTHAADVLSDAGGSSKGNIVRLLSIAGLTLATLGLFQSFPFLAAIPMWGWAALAIGSAIALFVSLFGKRKDKSLGEGDVTNFPTASTRSSAVAPLVGGLALMGVGAASPLIQGTAPTPVTTTSVAAAPALPYPSTTRAGSTNRRDAAAASSQIISPSGGRHGDLVIASPDAPEKLYRPFYVRTGQGPTGLTPDADTVQAVKAQDSDLNKALKAPSQPSAVRAVNRANAASHEVEISE
jgi:hypothetical protein